MLNFPEPLFLLPILFASLGLLLAVAMTVAPASDPIADPASIAASRDGEARFTILTPQLIRMEWCAGGNFEDRASLVFINRKLPTPRFTVENDGDWCVIRTTKLVLRYQTGAGKFSRDNLQILFELNGKPVHWHPGCEDSGNLGGTARTLDAISGAVPLEPGLISRSGWAVVDDSERPLLDDSEWPWVLQRPDSERQDWYFFGHGHDYKTALAEFTAVAGKIPLPPRFAFGYWWSRYWAYTDQEFRQLVAEFEAHDVPLDVLVIDMDWHLTFNLRWWGKQTDPSGHRRGWSGYTWDRTLFPDPAGFLRWTKAKGLKTPLNLHPASGVQPHEEQYEAMSHAMGIDPASQKYVPFDIVDKKFATHYLRLLHHPLEAMGVDFWWLDWQQEPTTQIAGVNPVWWLNYVHFTDMERRGQKRPLIFHRWGGLGNHRYQIGFSGDAYSNWKSLAFQPYFTATAANVGYGYWSHDIGGHLDGNTSPELYTRWLQFGVFSPILRTHATKNSRAERRIWAYPPEYYQTMRELFYLRYALIPYIYTAARTAYDTGVSICRPLYYEWPEDENAYAFNDQYLFGDEMLIAPIIEPLARETLLVKKKIWLPPGTWYEWLTGTRLQGPRVLDREFALDEMPVYVRAGAIIPLQPKMRNTGEKAVDPLILLAFPGAEGRAQIYEDAGDTLGYQRGEFAWTRMTQETLASGERVITISPREGSYPGMLIERGYEIRLVCEWPPAVVSCNGASVPFVLASESAATGWHYDGDKSTTVIRLPRFSTQETVEVRIYPRSAPQSLQTLFNGFPGKLARCKRVMPLLNGLWPREWSPEILVRAAQTGNRITLNPGNIVPELQEFAVSFPEIIRQIVALVVDNREPVERAIAHLTGVVKSAPTAHWREVVTTAAWSPRAGQRTVVFLEKLWLLGGQDRDGYRNDVWRTTDGAIWRCRVENGPWPARAHHAAVVHNGELFILGGKNATHIFNDIWRTSDGRKWQQTSKQAPWSARFAHTVVSFNGRLWLFGGENEDGKLNDIWVSTDGVSWELVAPGWPGRWTPRAGHAAAIYDGKIWLCGGFGQEVFSDVWASSDGAHWVRMAEAAPWLPRGGHALAVFERKLWLLGGSQTAQFNDVWFTENGHDWQESTDDAPWPPRALHDALAWRGGIWLVGGYRGRPYRPAVAEAMRHDVWVLEESQSTA